MPRLTDSQLVILSAAARRSDGAALPLPKSLKIKGAATTKTLEALRKKGFLEEKPAARDAAAWRETEDGARMTLVITEAGLQAIGAEPDAEASQTTGAAEPTPKKQKRTATAKPRPKGRAASDKTNADKARSRAGRKPSASKSKAKMASPPSVRPGTKQALLVDLLKRKRGATIAEIAEATGWQAHSVRGAISGALKKKLGLAVTSEKVDGRGRVYRIADRA